MAAPTTKRMNSHVSVSMVLLLWLLGSLGLACVFSESKVLAEDRAGDEGTLLLVRSWDPRSYTLVGWMPAYRAAIGLRYIAGEQPRFELNDAVTMTLPHPDCRPASVMQIAPDEELYHQGRLWLPVERERNLVRIGKTRFYVVSFNFGDSKWRRAATKE